MAEDKRSFLLYSDLIHTIKKVPDEVAGKLLKHILEYVNDLHPTTDDLMLEVLFEPIKQQLKRDLTKYEGIREKKSIAGKASARARKRAKEQSQQVLTGVESDDECSTLSTVNVNVSVNDNVNDINNNISTPVETGEKKSPIKNQSPPQEKEKEKSSGKKEKIDWDALLKLINKHTGRKFQVINKKTKDKYIRTLKEGYTRESIGNAIKNAPKAQNHIDNGCQHLTPEFFSRPDKIDMYSSPTTNAEEKIVAPKMNT